MDAAPPLDRGRCAAHGAMTTLRPTDGPTDGPAAFDAATGRAHAQAVVAASGTSFYWSMRLLPRAKRDAMYAIYAFCREVDDIADGGLPPAVKLAQLAAWRTEVEALFAGRASWPTTLALVEPVGRFDLPKAEFEAMIDGMEMDAGERMRAPPLAELERYCRCVAGAVGLLSVRVFGALGDGPAQGALALGEALQLTNILRDLTEDAARGRLYLPRELLERQGIAERDPDQVLDHPALPEVCAALAERARRRFEHADMLFAGSDRHLMRPALVMMQIYWRTLERLVARGWQRLDQPVRLAKPERLWLALRYGLL
jgi:squalene synthase HpnD